MKAMLLAAGEGSRLRPLTDDRPKPMLEIAGVPILEHNVRLLCAHGVREIVINVHHLPDVITEYFGDGSPFGASIIYSHETVLLGTAGGLKKMESYFADDAFFLVYGDNLTTLDLGALLELHTKKNATVTMALYEREDPRSSGIVLLNDDDRVLRYLEKPSHDQIFSRWVNAGYLVVDPRVFSLIPAARASDFGHDVFEVLVASGEGVYGYRMSELLWWIDSIQDLERTKRDAPTYLRKVAVQ